MTRAEAVEETAAAWLVRQDAGLSDAEAAAFETWLDADIRHRVEWLRLKAAWSQADRLGALSAGSAGEAVRRRRSPFLSRVRQAGPVVQAAAGLAASAVLAASLYVASIQIWGMPLSTEVGGRVVEVLDEGSRVELNTDSRVRISVNPLRRQVWLDRGEAYFSVAPDAARPFVISAGGPRIVVTGTQFSVQRHDGGVTVRVAEGAVIVRSESGESVSAEPGDEVRVVAGIVSKASRGLEQVQDEMGWRSGLLVFHDATLNDVAAQFNRYNRRKLQVADADVAQVRIGGAFAATNVDGFAALLESAYDLRVRRSGDEIIVSR